MHPNLDWCISHLLTVHVAVVGKAQVDEIDMLYELSKQIEGHTICALAEWIIRGQSQFFLFSRRTRQASFLLAYPDSSAKSGMIKPAQCIVSFVIQCQLLPCTLPVNTHAAYLIAFHHERLRLVNCDSFCIGYILALLLTYFTY